MTVSLDFTSTGAAALNTMPNSGDMTLLVALSEQSIKMLGHRDRSIGRVLTGSPTKEEIQKLDRLSPTNIAHQILYGDVSKKGASAGGELITDSRLQSSPERVKFTVIGARGRRGAEGPRSPTSAKSGRQRRKSPRAMASKAAQCVSCASAPRAECQKKK